MDEAVKRPVTTRDIADRAGVNQSTVSRALRNDAAVSERVRKQIRKLADEMGYRPNPFVSAFTAQVRGYRRSPRTAIIGFLYMEKSPPDFKDGYILGAHHRAEALGFKPEIIPYSDLNYSPERLNKMLWTRAISGLLVLPLTEHDTLAGIDFTHLATASVDPSVHEPLIHRAQPNYFMGMRLALETLRRKGYNRTAFCSLDTEINNIGNEWLGGFNGWQRMLPPMERGDAYIIGDITVPREKKGIVYPWGPDHFVQWVKDNRIEAIISNDRFFFDWIEDAGIGPPVTGLAALGYSDTNTKVSGVLQHGERVGAAAVDLIVSQIYRNEYGLPESRKTIMIDPSWQEAETTPPKK